MLLCVCGLLWGVGLFHVCSVCNMLFCFIGEWCAFVVVYDLYVLLCVVLCCVFVLIVDLLCLCCCYGSGSGCGSGSGSGSGSAVV